MTIKEVFCDMDGVLADFDWAKRHYGYDKMSDEEMWKNIRSKHPDWFYDLPPMAKMGTLWAALLKINDGRSPTVLTAMSTQNPSEGVRQKQDWIREYLGDSVPVIVCLRSHKQDWAGEGRLLVDDHEQNIAEWRAAGGIGILHTSVEDTLEQLKKLQ